MVRPLHDRVYRAILKLFPREFRGDFGEQMAEDFRDQRDDAASRPQRARLWIRTFADALRRAPAEHLDVLRRDAGYALRLFRGNPGFTTAVVLTLAIGVGSTTAVFTLADPMLFRPLPYPEPERLVEIYARTADSSRVMHALDFLRLEASPEAFEAVAAFGVANYVGGRLAGRTEEPFAYSITQRFFDVLRVRPFMGREFLPEEYQVRAAGDAAILTHRFWRTAFGGRADILSQTLDLEGPRGRRFRIVGVLPPDFVLPDYVNEAPDFFVGMKPDPALYANPNRIIWPIGRLAAGVTPLAAAAHVDAVLRVVEREYPQFGRGRQARVRSLREGLFGPVRTPLLMLLGATACVLLLACANLAHLFMARLGARQREFAVRLAIGAGRGRLVRLLVMEAAIFAVAGGVAALVFARWTFDVIMSQTPEFAHIYRLLPATLDYRVMLFAVVLAAVALLIFGVVPALRASRLDIRGSLVNGGASTSVRRRLTGDAALIFVQCAVALTLLVTGALLVGSFYRLAYQPLGFEPHAVRTVYVELPGAAPGDDTGPQVRRLYAHLRDRLPVPVTLADGWPALTLPGGVSRPEAGPKDPRPAAYSATGTFFDVFGIRLVSGRLYTDAEAFGDAPVAVVDRRAAAMLWPGQDPIGRQVVDRTTAARTVVGVVETLRTRLSDDVDTRGVAFLPFPSDRSLNLAYRDPSGSVSEAQLRAAVHEVLPGATVLTRQFRPFERTLGQPRFLALLLGALGLVAIALTVVGIFGVVNHEVVRRMREMGIRVACGADGGRIRRLIVRRALVPAILGIIAGSVASLWWTPTLRSLLFGLEPTDAATFVVAALFVVLTVLAASFVPAWRASRVDPVVVLRAE
jgi:predicted permease